MLVLCLGLKDNILALVLLPKALTLLLKALATAF